MSALMRSSGLARLLGRVLSTLALASWIFQSSIAFTSPAAAAGIYATPNVVEVRRTARQGSSFAFDVIPDSAQIDSAELIYLTPSAKTSAGVWRSINGGAAFGGLVQEDSFANKEIIEPISTSLLRQGRNTIVFMPNDFGDAPTIKMVRLQLHTIDQSGKQRTQVISPVDDGQQSFQRPVSFVAGETPIEQLVSTIDINA